MASKILNWGRCNPFCHIISVCLSIPSLRTSTSSLPLPAYLMDEQTALHEAIEQLYATFASYPLHHPVIGCTCCVSKADQERIASKALRQLAGYDLERFAWKAMSTW